MTNDPQLTEQDIEDLETLNEGSPVPKLHTIIEVWQAFLEPADEARDERVGPGYANKIVSTHPKLSYNDVQAYHTRFHDRIIEFRDAFDDALQSHLERKADALLHVDDDGEYNGDLYSEVLFRWHVKLETLDRTWDVRSKAAHIDVAVLIDLRAFFIGQMGIVAHLDSIGFDPDGVHALDIQRRLVAEFTKED